ncbi:MAG TPA: LuxR C-terminal-related transcriptional regulator [Arachnia sp.]|nr:LuxR C-terminal-related transcriptional regulator [Arachnia sp.]HMT86271.1 LuxR C-terminal-related transcriptional regulator [Arachnia sp.]
MPGKTRRFASDGRVALRVPVSFGTAPLTVIVAPAGFGKSTLMRTWRSQQGPDTATASGTFDAFHQTNALDAGLVLTDLARELGVPEPVRRDALSLLRDGGAELGREFVSRIGAALAGLPHRFVCFLDDMDALPDRVSGEVARLVSSVADERHRFVVASRGRLAWPVQRWRVSGFTDLVRADELLLSVEDIAELLGPGLAHLAPRAWEVTGGWAAAVETLRWRLPAMPSLRLEDAVVDLADYIVAEVLPALPPQDMQVLSRTSILDAFPGTVAVAVSGDPAAPRILEEVRARTSLLTLLDDGRYRYRFILREALRRHLAAHEPDALQELHACAAEAWLEEPNSFAAYVNAVDHLVEARSWHRAIDLASEGVDELDRHARVDLLVRWFDAVPGRHWRGDGKLLVLYCWASLRIGNVTAALSGLRSPVIADDPLAAAVGTLLHGAAMSWSVAPLDALDACERSLPTMVALDRTRSSDTPWIPGMRRYELAALWMIGQAQTLLGRFDDAVVTLEGVLHHRADLAPVAQISITGILGFALAMRGDIAAGRTRARESLQIAADAGLADRSVPKAFTLLALALAHLAGDGDLDEARRLTAEAASGCRHARTANLTQMCDLVGTMCGLRDSFLDQIEPALYTAPLPIVRQITVAAEARRRARLGDIPGAERRLSTIEPHELTLSAWVEVLLSRVERRRVARWVALRSSPTCLRGRIGRLLAEAAAVESVTDATRLAVQAADLAAPGGLVGLLLDAPEQLWARLDVDHASHPLLIEAAARRRTATTDGSLPTLTARELEVLRLLPYVETARDLAERLQVSVNTAKWHLANIYRKLGVRGRAAALDRAAEFRLIEP